MKNGTRIAADEKDMEKATDYTDYTDYSEFYSGVVHFSP